jgi:hypothetical protein
VVGLKSGGFISIWQSTRQDKQGWDIYGQVYTAKGECSGKAFRINSQVISEQRAPAVGALADGTFVVVWESSNQDGQGYGIYAQRYSEGGIKQGGEFKINTTCANHQQSARVVGLANGGFVVVWESLNQDGQGYGIYGQRYDGKGIKLGGEFQVNSISRGEQKEVAVASLKDGGYLVSWQGYEPNAKDWDIYAQRYNAQGQRIGGQFRVNSLRVSHQTNASCIGLTDGGYVVVWQSLNQSGFGWNIYAKRYDAQGKVIRSDFRVNSHIKNHQELPRVASLNDGSFVVVWQSDKQDGSGYGLYGKRYDAETVAQGEEFQINSYSQGHQKAAAIASLSDNRFVAVWESQIKASTSYGVYGQLFSCEAVRYHLAARDLDIVADIESEALPYQYGIVGEETENTGLMDNEQEAYIGYSYTGDESSDQPATVKPMITTPDASSSFMLAMVLGKLLTSAYEGTKQVVQELKTHCLGATDAELTEATPEIQQACAELKETCEKLMQEKHANKWLCYELEDKLEELEQAEPGQITAADIQQWQEDIRVLIEDYGVAGEAVRADSAKGHSFFKPQQQPVYQPDQAGLPQQQAQQRVAA